MTRDARPSAVAPRPAPVDCRLSTVDSRESGITLIEAVFASLIVAIVLGGAFLVMSSSLAQLSHGKDLEVAKLACARARENLTTVRFRAADASDSAEWLFLGSYEIARNQDETSFLMPDARTCAATTVDGVGGAVVIEFPVPPLAPLPGRTHAGRLIFFVDESQQPSALPATGFPFPPTPGYAHLDLNGNGTPTDAADIDIRTGHSLASWPCRLVPLRLAVEWRSRYGDERYEEAFLLGYQGYE